MQEEIQEESKEGKSSLFKKNKGSEYSEGFTGSLPPYDTDSEMSVLGAFLIDNNTVSEVYHFLSSKDFYFTEHRLICTIIYDKVIKEKKIIDGLILANELKKIEKLEDVGGRKAIARLTEWVPSISNVAHYANIVRNLSIKRKLIEASNTIRDLGYNNIDDVFTLLGKAEETIFDIAKDAIKRDFVPIKDVASEYSKLIDERNSSYSSFVIETGFSSLDKKIGGFHKQDLVIIAARPSIGKTSFALNISLYNAIKKNKTVAIFSIETPKEQVFERFVAQHAEIHGTKLRTGKLDNKDFEVLAKTISDITKTKIYIDDTPDISISQIAAKAKRLSMEEKLDLIVIDYLQLIMSDEKTENRVLEVSRITRSLKTLARYLDVPVVVLSQLSRNIEQREQERFIPVLSDLRDSGSIEQDADIVIFLYTKPIKKIKYGTDNIEYTPEDSEKDIVNIKVGKNRNGETPEIRLRFLKDYTKFISVEEHYRE